MKPGDRIVAVCGDTERFLYSEGRRGVLVAFGVLKMTVLVRFDDSDMVYEVSALNIRTLDLVERVGELDV